MADVFSIERNIPEGQLGSSIYHNYVTIFKNYLQVMFGSYGIMCILNVHTKTNSVTSH